MQKCLRINCFKSIIKSDIVNQRKSIKINWRLKWLEALETRVQYLGFDDFEIEEIDISEMTKNQTFQSNNEVNNIEQPKINNQEKEKIIDEIIKEPKVEEETRKAKNKKANHLAEEKSSQKETVKKRGRKKKEDKKIIEFVPKDQKELIKELEEEIESAKKDIKTEIGDDLENAIINEQPEKKRRGRKKKEEIIEKDSPKLKILKEKSEEIKEKTSRRKQILETKERSKEVRMQVDESQNMMILTLKSKKCKLDMMPEEYNVYTNGSKSYIIVRQDKLKLQFIDTYFNISKDGEIYTIETDEDIKLDYVMSNLTKRDNKIIFSVTNLSEITIDEDNLKITIDENKFAESKLEDNNMLVISEEDKKVYLPYKREEILQELKKNKKMTIEEIIEKKYTRSLDIYKNASKARFNEAYKLMKEREHETKNKAIMLGVELMFEFNLHPAIISACKNLEQLDIYLDCLEDNELEKFTCFKIIYKGMPKKSKKSKKANKKNEYMG